MNKEMLLAALTCTLAFAPRCERIDVTGNGNGNVDSLTTVIIPNCNLALKSADVFLYSDRDVRRLEGHVRLSGKSDSAFIKVPAGDKIAVVIANSPRTFNDLALTSFDSMEILPFHFQDEIQDFPMMSGSSTCRAGDTLVVAVSSVMCSVKLRSIEHNFTGYRRLEDPIVLLENVNSSVEVLRRDAFLPSETSCDTVGMRGLMWDKLPYDVGMYVQYPGISLHCYPNESSVSRTKIVVEGKVDGNIRRFSTDLPLMSAGCTISADLVIESEPDRYSFSIF